MKILSDKDLAVNGGKPTRIKPFLPSCYSSGNDEKKLLNECLDSLYWSSYKGATEGWDIDEVGRMKSIEANKFKPLDMRFLGGKYVRQFEKDFSKKFNVDFSVSSNSATSCLVMALGALDLGPGDEVFVPLYVIQRHVDSNIIF